MTKKLVKVRDGKMSLPGDVFLVTDIHVFIQSFFVPLLFFFNFLLHYSFIILSYSLFNI